MSETPARLIEMAATAVGTPLARAVAELARTDQLTRAAVSSAASELGLDSEAQLREGVNLLVEAARRAILDHSISLSEMDGARTIQRVFGIEGGHVLRFRRDDVADLVREAMERVLSDTVVTRREGQYKVALQEAFALSYDEFLELARAQHDAALRAVLAKIDHDGRGMSYERFKEFHLRAAHLDSVFQVDLLAGGDQDGSPGRYIPADVKTAVWRRDQGRCARCGSQERLEFDHIVPHSKGGSNTYRNVQLLCERCNRAKRADIAG